MGLQTYRKASEVGNSAKSLSLVPKTERVTVEQQKMARTHLEQIKISNSRSKASNVEILSRRNPKN